MTQSDHPAAGSPIISSSPMAVPTNEPPGTTTTEVVRGLPLNHDITVVTNTVNVAMELSKRKDLKIFVTGGHLQGDWFSLVGPTAVQSLSQLLITTAFIGADGRILNIEDMAPQTENTHPSRGLALYTLEMKKGWFADRGIASGDQVAGLEKAPKAQE